MSVRSLLWRRPPHAPDRVPFGAPLIDVRGASVTLSGRAIVDNVELTVHAGAVIALVGPNGAGKSTLLAAMSGDIELSAGTVRLADRDAAEWTHVEAAMRRAVLPQRASVAFPFSVRDVVRMGRVPWAGTDREDDDESVVNEALHDADVAELAWRPFATLSGGEQARVTLARVLAQRAQLMLLDEPTAALDIRHQEMVLSLAVARAAHGDGVVVVLHDLALAAAHADIVVVLDAGRVVAAGPVADVLTADLLSDVYRCPIDVSRHPIDGRLLVTPRRGALPGRKTL